MINLNFTKNFYSHIFFFYLGKIFKENFKLYGN